MLRSMFGMFAACVDPWIGWCVKMLWSCTASGIGLLSVNGEGGKEAVFVCLDKGELQHLGGQHIVSTQVKLTGGTMALFVSSGGSRRVTAVNTAS